ncbi:MAG: hypothetical protein ACRC2H_01380 [Silanimonas sp.]
MATSKLAVALSDIVSHGVKAGQILQSAPNVIAALEKDGYADSNKAAIEAARAGGANVVQSSIDLAAQAREQQRETLLVQIAEKKDLLSKAEDEATKAALGNEVQRLEADLQAL